ncbi:MAG: hypothetical protein AMXMBFR82_06460 [Candidatus Hydrogenedentota bacterium]
MLSQAIESVTLREIQDLVQYGYKESRRLEYKLLCPGDRDRDKKEFLADVSSFANTVGGYILFGVREQDGTPKELVGIEGFDEDKERTRLESILHYNLQPPILGVELRCISGGTKGPVVVMRIPRSSFAPHMITLQQASRFYGRHSNGKYQMTYFDIRGAFMEQLELAERIHKWQAERIERICCDDTPALLSIPERLIIHIVPLQTVGDEYAFSAQEVFALKQHFLPMAIGGQRLRINVDGSISHSVQDDLQAYCQFFRSGRIESVLAGIVQNRDGRRFIPSVFFERIQVEAISRYFKGLRALSIAPPIHLFFAIVGAKGAHMATKPAHFYNTTVIDRDYLRLPDVTCWDYEEDIPTLLRPVFDSVWNACGIEASPHFDKDGKWSTG